MTETRSVDKPFGIPKTLVWNAYQRVKANKGAAGVDRQSVTEFEQDEQNNLYKLWNRMASGSYFPPPVRAVEIPKHGGGVRTLGVPTVSDDRTNGGGHGTEPGSGEVFPSGLVWVSAG